MKKLCTVFFITLVLVAYYSACHAQTTTPVQKKIEHANNQFIKWFNAGKADSILTQYHVNACITGKGCGREFIQNHYKSEIGTYTVRDLTTLSVTVKDNVATETGKWTIQLSNGTELYGKYQTEWQQVNNRWVIFKETVLQ